MQNHVNDDEEEEGKSFDIELESTSAQRATRGPNALERLILSFRHLFLKPIRASIVVLYVITFLDSFAYYAFTYSLLQHLGLELGLSDKMSYWFYGIYGTSVALSGMVFGVFVDALGPRAAICISSTVSFVARVGLAYAVLFEAAWLTGIILFGLVAPSVALIGPPIPIALKRYTNVRSRYIGTALYYGIMNAAAFSVTPLVDMWRISGRDSTFGLPPFALIIAMTSVLQVPILLLALIGLKNVKMTDHNTVISYTPDPLSSKPSFIQQVREMLRDRMFWKAFVLVTCLVGAKSTFRYMDTLYLTYVMRAFPDGRTQHYLTLLAINPLLVIVFTLSGVSVLFTSRFNPIAAITLGVGIGGAAPFFLAFGPFLWTLVAYVVTTTVGEIIWSPVVVAYLTNISPEGKEGLWMSLGALPTFMSKLLTGGLTGTLTSAYCPDPALLCPAHDPLGDFKPVLRERDPVESLAMRAFTPSNDCRYVNNTLVDTPPPSQPVLWGDPNQCYSLALWGIIGATTITSFIALLILYRWLKPTTSTGASKYEEVYDDDDDEEKAAEVSMTSVRRNATIDDDELGEL